MTKTMVPDWLLAWPDFEILKSDIQISGFAVGRIRLVHQPT
jgi:hypothetical protein